MASKQANDNNSSTTRNTVTIVLLLSTFIIPLVGVIGLIVMWLWTTWKKWVKILITTLFILPFVLITVFLVTYIFIARPFHVVGQAMYPTYKDGEYVLTTVHPNHISRGDVIIFISPVDEKKFLIKRVVGVPGDIAELKNGFVYINGKKLDESSYLKSTISTNEGTDLIYDQPDGIPNGYYFVLGDNRASSSDSRDWGPIPQQLIISKVDFCYWNCR